MSRVQSAFWDGKHAGGPRRELSSRLYHPHERPPPLDAGDADRGPARYYFSAQLVLMNILIDTAAALYAGALVVGILYPGRSPMPEPVVSWKLRG